MRGLFYGLKSATGWKPAFYSFWGILLFANIDRFILGKHASIRQHDWYDSNSYFWSQCYSWADFFNFNKVNSSILGGYDCQIHGLPPFNPVAVLLGTMPADWTYQALFLLTAFMCFLGIFYFARAINFPLHWSMVSFLALTHVYSVINYYHLFSLDPAALLLSAWIIKGRRLSPHPLVPPLLIGSVILFALSMPAPFYVPFHTLTTIIIPFLFIGFCQNGWKGILKRYFLFWATLAALNLYTLWIVVTNTKDSLRSEFYPYWGPFSLTEIIAEAQKYLIDDLTVLWLAVPAFLALLCFSTHEKNKPKSFKVFYISVLTFIAIFTISRFFAPLLTLLTKDINPKPMLLMNHWSRFYLTFHSLLLACIFCGLKQFQPFHFTKNIFRVRLGISFLCIFGVYWFFSKNPIYSFYSHDSTTLLNSTKMIIVSILIGLFSFWSQTKKGPLPKRYLHCGLILFLLCFVVLQRRALVRRIEPYTFSSLHAPGIKKFANDITNEDQQIFRSITIAIHPIYAAVHGFKMADGYLSSHSLSYKKIFQRAFEPALTENKKGNDIIPYFRHWGGRAYVFLPGSGEGVFQIKCPPGVIDFNSLANVPEMKKLGVRWVFSRCQIKHPELNEIRMPLDDYLHVPAQPFSRLLFDARPPDNNISNYVYEVKNALPIFESRKNGIFIRANVCHSLKRYGYANTSEKFGFLIDKNSPEWNVAVRCYPFLENF